MNVVYLDSSCLVAVAFGESGARRVQSALRTAGRVVASPLLEAESLAAFARESVELDTAMFEGIDWVLPQRSLRGECRRALAHGPLKGADLWHVACALFLDPSAQELSFLTLDQPQRRVAAALGFKTP